jgi:hypothetical protein
VEPSVGTFRVMESRRDRRRYSRCSGIDRRQDYSLMSNDAEPAEWRYLRWENVASSIPSWLTILWNSGGPISCPPWTGIVVARAIGMKPAFVRSGLARLAET